MLYVFLFLTVITALFTANLLITGISPGAKPLEWMGFVYYGAGFYYLVALWILAIVFKIAGFILKKNDANLSLWFDRSAWVALGLLLILDLSIWFDINS